MRGEESVGERDAVQRGTKSKQMHGYKKKSLKKKLFKKKGVLRMGVSMVAT